MSERAESFARAAEQMIGAPFRLCGRDPRFGIDCAGLVIAALRESGTNVPPVPTYRLRNDDYRLIDHVAHDAGFVPVTGTFARGDLLLVRPGPAQRHFLIASGPDRFVHAHAGLRRVVVQYGPIGWPVAAQFRLREPEPGTTGMEAY